MAKSSSNPLYLYNLTFMRHFTISLQAYVSPHGKSPLTHYQQAEGDDTGGAERGKWLDLSSHGSHHKSCTNLIVTFSPGREENIYFSPFTWERAASECPSHATPCEVCTLTCATWRWEEWGGKWIISDRTPAEGHPRL
uniref:Uncharacterized protein n=1 Tax=Anopheles arabiensis TaxID=7173 RepID=A0A182IH38_ANOAR